MGKKKNKKKKQEHTVEQPNLNPVSSNQATPNYETPTLIIEAVKLQRRMDTIHYNAGNNDLLDDILNAGGKHEKYQKYQIEMVSRLIKQPTAIYCNREDVISDSENHLDSAKEVCNVEQ